MMQQPPKIGKLKHLVLKYFWERRNNSPEWKYLLDTLEIEDETELLNMFKWLGFKENK